MQSTVYKQNDILEKCKENNKQMYTLPDMIRLETAAASNVSDAEFVGLPREFTRIPPRYLTRLAR